MLWLVIGSYLCQQNAAFEGNNIVVSLEDKLSAMLNFGFYVLFTLPVTTFLKRETARDRPSNPEKGSPNARYFNLRGHEKNCSMPSGDTT